MKRLFALYCLLLFASTGLAQQRQPKKVVDPVSDVDHMPVLTDTGTALNMPSRRGQGTAVAMPTWTGEPAIRYEETISGQLDKTISGQLKDIDRLKRKEYAQPDSAKHTPFFQFPRKDRKR